MFDVVFTGGQIIDGTGAARFPGTVAIKDGLLRILPPVQDVSAKETVDAGGLFLTPGFIDPHSHSDFGLIHEPAAESRISQGVTTEVIGNCGYSPAPIGDLWLTWWFLSDQVTNDFGEVKSGLGGSMVMERARQALGEFGINVTWRSMGEYLETLDKIRPAVNVVPAIGHNTIRTLVMNVEPRAASGEEIARMRELVRGAMEDGAFGFSTGLTYVPGRYSKTAEVIELCKEAARHGGLYFTHMRDEADDLHKSVCETIGIASMAGIRTQISHFKALGRANWGKALLALEMIDHARDAGAELGVDVYPYSAGSIMQAPLKSLLTPLLQNASLEEVLKSLQSAEGRSAASQAIRKWSLGETNLQRESPFQTAGGPGGVIITRSALASESHLWGKSIEEIAANQGLDPYDAVIALVERNNGKGFYVTIGMSEDDICTILSHKGSVVGSDGQAGATVSNGLSRLPHPRSFGTFPRVLSHYALSKKLFSFEEGVHRMTGATADFMGIKKRGYLREGYCADLVLVDPVQLRDMATYTDPYAHAAGIERVYVNGILTWKGGTATGDRGGHVLRR